MDETSKEQHWPETGDVSLILFFAARRRLSEPGDFEEQLPDRIYQQPGGVQLKNVLIEPADLGDFLLSARQAFIEHEHGDVLRRALGLMIPTSGEASESSFLKLFSALEAALTFFRRENEYDILPSQQFSELARDLKKWLKQHPLLEDEPEKRALMYEKVRELNRFPFSHTFKRFCQSYDLYLDDLWPLLDQLDKWPLLEIRHRLVHGDPFLSRPQSALQCATSHLRWTAERMLLSLLGWPISRSNASPERLAQASDDYQRWPAERARFA